MEKKKTKLTIIATRVGLKSGNIDSDKHLYLVRAKSKSLTMYLLTNLPDLYQESLMEVFQAYLNRWKVEEYIRFVKQQYGLEKFQVLSLGKIRNLIELLFIATVILARLSELVTRFSMVRSVLINKAKRTYKIPQKLKFFLYLTADGLAYILKKVKNLEKTQKKTNKQKQLVLLF